MVIFDKLKRNILDGLIKKDENAGGRNIQSMRPLTGITGLSAQ